MRNFSDIFYICQIRYPSTLNCILIRASSMRWWSCNLCQSCNLTAKGYCNKKFGGATIAQWILPPLLHIGVWSSGHRAPTITVRILLKFTVYNLQKYIRKEWKTVIYSKKFINTLLSIKYTQPRPLFAHTMNVKKLDVRGTRTQISFIKDIKMCPNLHHSTKHWDSFSLKKILQKMLTTLKTNHVTCSSLDVTCQTIR